MNNPNFRVPGSSKPSDNGLYLAIFLLIIVAIGIGVGVYLALNWLKGVF